MAVRASPRMLRMDMVRPAVHGRFLSPANLFFSGQAGGWWDPSDLSTLWQDTAGTIPVAVNNTTVARMDDKSGNGNHLVQATATNQLTYQTDGTYHWLRAFGTNDYMDKAFAISQPWERVSAIRQVTWTNGERIFSGIASNNGLLYQTGVTPSLTMFSGLSLVLGGFTLDTDGVITERHAGASSRVALNNGAYVTGNAGTVATDGFRIGAVIGAPPASFSDIRFYGAVMRAGTMTDAEITNLRKYFAAKAGVTL